MTNREFLEEAQAYEGCPKDFAERYAYFCGYQKMAFDMLKEFVRVCDKHGILYALSSGSLLGIVRDGGQIPWDYDVDLTVPYFEKDRLCRALDEDLDGRYRYYVPGRDSRYRPSIMRIVPKGYMHQVIHVDVFFLIGLPEDRNEREAYCREVREKVRARMYVAERLSDYPYPLKTKLHNSLLKLKYLARYGKEATGDNDALFSRYDLREAPCAAAVSTKCGKSVAPAARYLGAVKYHTKHGDFLVPGDYEEYLKMKYGDWTKYLPVEKRIREVEKQCRLFEWYEGRMRKASGKV